MSTLRIRGRRSAILPTLVIIAVLVVAFAIFVNFWTDRLWFNSTSTRSTWLSSASPTSETDLKASEAPNKGFMLCLGSQELQAL